jgi:hypothetical protein
LVFPMGVGGIDANFLSIHTPPWVPYSPPQPLHPCLLEYILFNMESYKLYKVGCRGGGRVSPGRGGDRGYGTIGYYRVLPSDRGTPDTHGECSMVYPRGETAA